MPAHGLKPSSCQWPKSFQVSFDQRTMRPSFINRQGPPFPLLPNVPHFQFTVTSRASGSHVPSRSSQQGVAWTLPAGYQGTLIPTRHVPHFAWHHALGLSRNQGSKSSSQPANWNDRDQANWDHGSLVLPRRQAFNVPRQRGKWVPMFRASGSIDESSFQAINRTSGIARQGPSKLGSRVA